MQVGHLGSKSKSQCFQRSDTAFSATPRVDSSAFGLPEGQSRSKALILKLILHWYLKVQLRNHCPVISKVLKYIKVIFNLYCILYITFQSPYTPLPATVTTLWSMSMSPFSKTLCSVSPPPTSCHPALHLCVLKHNVNLLFEQQD